MIALLLGAVAWGADEVVFGDELAPNWYDWSWSGIPDFTSNDAHEGKYAAFTSLKSNGGFSIYRNSGLGEASALRFWAKGSGEVAIRFAAVGEGQIANDVRLSPALSSSWTEYTISIDDLPAHNWDRISWADTSGLGGALHVDEIELLDDNPQLAFYTSVEPMPPNHVVVYGAGNPNAIEVRLDGKPLAIESVRTEGGPSRTYVSLVDDLGPGTLEVVTSDGIFERTLRGASITIDDTPTHQISLDIYGANFNGWPPSPAHMERYGYTVVRWGGEELAAYNPATRTANPGEDGFFINYVTHPSLEAWYREMDRDLSTILTVPNFGWVAKASSYWQFSVDDYGPQQRVSPDNSDAGNGLTPSGGAIDNDRGDAAERFNAADAEAWLTKIDPIPDFFAIGNELDTAHDKHRGLVKGVADYDERLRRFLDFARAAKAAQPQVPVLGPVSSGWFSYWNTEVAGHKTAKGGTDYLEWFLDEVASADSAGGRRTLDYLDVHYTPEDLGSHATDHDWRLQATRSLWDPTFVDDSWVGTEAPVTTQSDPHVVQLVPRLKGLIEEHYPGTKLSISEWTFGSTRNVAGGLAAADVLGIFGRYDVDMALIDPAPPIGSYTGAAFELYRSGLLTYGRSNLPVQTTGLDPEEGSVFASRHASGRITVVIVNKSTHEDLFFDVTGVPEMPTRTKHFGGAVEARVVESPASDTFRGHLVVPAYTAMLVEIDADGPTDTGGNTDRTDSTETGDTGAATDTDGTGRRCGCTVPTTPTSAWLVLLLGGLVARRRAQSLEA